MYTFYTWGFVKAVEQFVDLFCRISEHSDVNKMSIDNLAVCWWPTILRPNFDSFESMNMVSKYLEEVIKIIIRQHRFFFYGENEV